MVSLFKGTEEEKEAVGDLLQRYGAILRVISSKSRKVNVPKFQDFCTETYFLQKVFFPWAPVSPSLHRLLGHSAELVEKNKSCTKWRYDTTYS